MALITDFIWRRIYCEHVRLEQYHVPLGEAGKLGADPILKDALKIAKFRW